MERKSVDVQSSARKSDAGVDTEGLRDGVQLINGSASSISGKYAFNPQATITETPTVEKFRYVIKYTYRVLSIQWEICEEVIVCTTR